MSKHIQETENSKKHTTILTGNLVGLFYMPVDTLDDKIIGAVRFWLGRVSGEYASRK